MRNYRTLPLTTAALLIAALVAIPLAVVLSYWLIPAPEIWSHLREVLLPGLLVNTLTLLVGVLVLTATLGISLAWLVARYRFPGSRLLRWALMLPLAMPAYVLAFVQTGLLDYTGPVQTLLRVWFGSEFQLPPIRSLGGAIGVLGLCLYPYVYLLARNAFERQGRRTLEAAQSLGSGPTAAFFRAALPQARPWIAAGLLLVLMETLADFGAVYILGVDTFTTAIYKAWFSLFSLTAANQLAAVLILIALVLLLGEKYQRRAQRFADRSAGLDNRVSALDGVKGMAASGYAWSVLTVALGIPAVQLLIWAWPEVQTGLDARFWQFLWHTLVIGGLAALLVTILALILAYAEHRLDNRLSRITAAVASMGYAIPGVVLAVGVFQPLSWLDQALPAVVGSQASGWLTGTLAALLLALSARFLAVALAPVSSGFNRIQPGMIFAARSLGASGLGLVRRIHLPLIGGSLLSAALLVFVDVMKEMPITLMTRPFGWETLSVRIFELTSEGQWQQAALPALTLLAVGLIPVLWLGRRRETTDATPIPSRTIPSSRPKRIVEPGPRNVYREVEENARSK